jgi:cytochrome c oxidase subunit IV
MDTEEPKVIVQPVNKDKIRQLLKVAAILGAVTFFEFVIAFTMDSSPLRTTIFILMTIVKAAYIVGEFMHLRYEVKMLMWTILIPMLFVLWLLIALIYEGGAILEVR